MSTSCRDCQELPPSWKSTEVAGALHRTRWSRSGSWCRHIEIVLVGENHSTYCCMLRRSHQEVVLPPGNAIFFTKDLSFIVAFHFMLLVGVSAGIDSTNKGRHRSLTCSQNLLGELLQVKWWWSSFFSFLSCWAVSIGRKATLMRILVHRKISRSNQFLLPIPLKPLCW